MDEAKKRAFREAWLGRLVITRVGLSAAPFKAGAYSIEHDRFQAQFLDENGDICKGEFDKALVRAAHGRAIDRERTYAEVGREVCTLIEMARLWVKGNKKKLANNDITYPTKGQISKKVTAMAGAAEKLIEQLEDFNNQWIGYYSPYYEREKGISHKQILETLKEAEKHFREEIPSDLNWINGPESFSTVAFVDMLEESFEQLFGVTARVSHRRCDNHDTAKGRPKEWSVYEGHFVPFALIVSKGAGLNLSADAIAKYRYRAKQKI
jgi:hypothetical protein